MNLIKRTFLNITNKIKGNSLKVRCARSGIILGIGAFIAKLLAMGSKIVMTRLLAPEAVGLMVMILSLTQLFQILMEVGIKQSVVQHKNGAKIEYLNMAWWFQSLRGIGLYAVALILAPWFCEFYFSSKIEIMANHTMGELILLLRVAFLNVLFSGFLSPRAHVLEKNFKFGKAVIITQGSFAFGAIVSIILVFIIRNVWAMVIGFTTIGLFRCLMSYILCPFMPRFAYDKDSFQSLYRFARGILGLPILTYIAFNIDVLVAGKFVSMSLVGMYGMALIVASIPKDLFNRIIAPILLPAFAEKQDNKIVLRYALLQISKFIALGAFPLIVLTIFCGKTILSIVYGSQYATMAIPFSMMCTFVFLTIQGSVIGGMFFGLGQPSKHRYYVLVRVLLTIIMIYPAVKTMGLTGAAIAVSLACGAALIFQVAVMQKLIGLRICDYFLAWLPGLALAVFVALTLFGIKRIMPEMAELHLIFGSLSCIVYFLASLILLKHFKKLNTIQVENNIIAKPSSR